MNITDARQRFTELIRDLSDPIYVTIYGDPKAVIVRYDTYEALLERLEELQDSVDVLKRRGEPTMDWEEFEAEMIGVPAPA
jgi:prevent-host-death family protein